jgi:gamma-tubulin complex component 3
MEEVVMEARTQHTHRNRLGYRYASDTTTATRTVKHAEQQVNQHIVTSLRDTHHLVQHLRGLKQFLLFGQGDFASVMMEGLHAKFDRKGIIGLYDYDLMGIIEGALKCTNAADIPSYVAKRRRVSNLPYATMMTS